MARKGQEFTWANFPVRKDADGWHCRKCGTVLTGRKTAWCGPACLKAVLLLVDWRIIRRHIRRRDKWKCQMLLENGGLCLRPATDVDHIVELADGGSFHDWTNLRSLCYECHQKKTLMMRKARAERKKAAKVDEKAVE